MAKVVAAKSSGFVPVSAEQNYRLVFRSFGPEKTGKNHFGLSGPGPIAIQCFDILGVQNTAEKFVRAGKHIAIKKYKFKRDTFLYPTKEAMLEACAVSQAQAQDIRDEFREDFAALLESGDYRTIQWDESELWEVCRFAEFGKGSDRPASYDPLNAFYREMIHLVDDYPVNLQLIQKVKEKWESVVTADGKEKGRPSGKFVPYGMKEVGYIVDTNLGHGWSKEEGFTITVQNCRANMALAGETFANTSFPELATLIFGEESEASWS